MLYTVYNRSSISILHILYIDRPKTIFQCCRCCSINQALDQMFGICMSPYYYVCFLSSVTPTSVGVKLRVLNFHVFLSAFLTNLSTNGK